MPYRDAFSLKWKRKTMAFLKGEIWNRYSLRKFPEDPGNAKLPTADHPTESLEILRGKSNRRKFLVRQHKKSEYTSQNAEGCPLLRKLSEEILLHSSLKFPELDQFRYIILKFSLKQ